MGREALNKADAAPLRASACGVATKERRDSVGSRRPVTGTYDNEQSAELAMLEFAARNPGAGCRQVN
jgi:hypothetical protein